MSRPAKSGETTRIYIVTNTKTGAETLVRTSASSIAQRHVSETDYHTAIATQRDLERLLPVGTPVIDLSAAPSQPELTLT